MLFDKKKKPVRATDRNVTRKLANASKMLSYKIENIQDIGKRPDQQDSFCLLGALDVHETMENGLFAVVADGMGGLANGKAVSEAVIAGLCRAYHRLSRDRAIGTQLAAAVQELNESMYVQFEGQGGSTVTEVLIYHDSLYWLSVGDSSLFLRRDRHLYRLNEYHTLRNELYRELIADGYVGSNRENANCNKEAACLTQFLGQEQLTQIDYNRQPLRLRAGDSILLCSDGVSGTIPAKELNRLLDYEPQQAGQEILRYVQSAPGNQDNSTAILITCCG